MTNDDPSNEEDAIKVDLCSVWRHLIDSNSILRSLHDTNPALCRHHIEEGHHWIQYIVKVLILVDPVTAIVEAIIFIFDMSLEYLRNILLVANEENSFVKVGAQNSEEHNE